MLQLLKRTVRTELQRRPVSSIMKEDRRKFRLTKALMLSILRIGIFYFAFFHGYIANYSCQL